MADKNHAGYPSNSVTLVTNQIIKMLCFDATEPSNGNSDRRGYGNNRYIYSNLRQWLNSPAAAGQWYTAQHSADQTPDSSHVWNGVNPYSGLAGFLNAFTANERAALLNTTITVGKSSTDGGGTETCTDKIFPLSCTEVGLSGDHVCGSKLAIFSDNNSRIATVTASCVANSNYSSNPGSGAAWYYWLRDAYADALRLLCQPERSAGAGCTYSLMYYEKQSRYHAKDPKPGDQIFFSTAHSKSNVSHTGLVEKVDGSKVYTIEGNTSDQVARRSYYLSDSYIVGYGRPAYDAEPGNTNTGSQTPSSGTTSEVAYTVVAGDTLSKIAAKYGTTYQKLAAYNGITNPNIIRVGQKIKIPGTAAPKKTNAEIAKEVIAGKWGNGADRKRRLEAAGYDYNAIQQAVNAALAR